MKFFLKLANVLVALGGLLAGSAQASNDYPNKPVRLIIPFAAGGPADLVGREIARALDKELGQPIVVVNQGGGHGMPAINQVLNAPADGYTLMMPASGNLTIPSKAMEGRDVLKELAPISQVTQSPHVLVVSSKLPVKSVSELIAYAKAHPGKVNFGSAGTGGLAHLGMELFKSEAKVDVVHVPYKGTSQVVTDLASGEVQALFSSMPSLKPLMDKGSVRAIGMSAPSKGEITSRIPLISAQGLPQFTYTTWYGLFAKEGTPQAIIDRLNSALVKVLSNPELNQKFEPQGIEFITGTPKALADMVRRDQQKWKQVIQEAGITIE